MVWVTVHVCDFGARGDGITDDTQAFREAIRFVESAGGGTLTVGGPGSLSLTKSNANMSHQYRIWPIQLTSNLIFYIEKGATISAFSDEELWPLDPPLPSYGGKWRHAGFISARNISNATIMGEGVESIIDGQGEYWWEKTHHGHQKHSPGRLIEIMYSQQIRLMNLQLIGSPSWNVHMYNCDDVHIKEVHINEPESAPFVDGFDPDSSSNILIEDSTYSGGDDCVAIKSGWDCFGLDYNKPSVNITVRNVSCHGFSAGIAIGSEMSGGVENVTIENVRFTKANKPADIKVGRTRGGYVKNIVFREITVTGTIQRAIHVDMFHYNDSPNPNCPKDWKPPSLTSISDISFLRFDGTNASYIDYQHRPNETFHFYAYEESPIRKVFMQDVYFPPNENGVDWNCSAVEGVVVNGTIHPWPPCPGFEIQDASQSEVKQMTLPVHIGVYRKELLLRAIGLGLLVALSVYLKKKMRHK